MTRAKSPGKSRTSASHSSSATPSASPAASPTSNGPNLRQLAHELNSLLDGSMRCVGLARTSLQKQHTSNGDAIDDGLGKAHAAMQHMAALLARAMKPSSTAGDAATVMLFHDDQTMSGLLDELRGLLAPHAAQARATMRFQLEPDCRDLPAGPLGAVLMNGLRNALQACEACDDEANRIASLTISCSEEHVNIAITSPAAAKPAGQRIGLGLSEQIVAELGGEMALSASGDTCVLRICVPKANLKCHA